MDKHERGTAQINEDPSLPIARLERRVKILEESILALLVNVSAYTNTPSQNMDVIIEKIKKGDH